MYIDPQTAVYVEVYREFISLWDFPKHAMWFNTLLGGQTEGAVGVQSENNQA